MINDGVRTMAKNINTSGLPVAFFLALSCDFFAIPHSATHNNFLFAHRLPLCNGRVRFLLHHTGAKVVSIR